MPFMASPFRRWWNYLKAKMNSSLNERADPKVQLEQAIAEAQDQHRRLKEQAANVIANQKQTEMQLNRAMADLESTNAKARQAVLMADDANKRGDTAKATEYTKAAEGFAASSSRPRSRSNRSSSCSLQSTQAADQAKAAVQQNSALLQQKLAERQKLLSQLDQAKMQEQMNTGHGQPVRGGRPGRAHPRGGPRQDRGSLRAGARRRRDPGPDRGVPHARGRAGVDGPVRRRSGSTQIKIQLGLTAAPETPGLGPGSAADRHRLGGPRGGAGRRGEGGRIRRRRLKAAGSPIPAPGAVGPEHATGRHRLPLTGPARWPAVVIRGLVKRFGAKVAVAGV